MSCITDLELVFDPLRKGKVQKFTDLNIEKHMPNSRKLLSNFIQKTLQTAFFSEKNIFKVKKLYNSHNDVVDVLKKMRKVKVP